MWDFHRYWIYALMLTLIVVICVSCSTKPSKQEREATEKANYLEQVIRAAKKAGCKKYQIVIDQYLQTTRFTCTESE
jgi:hypothetical protein